MNYNLPYLLKWILKPSVEVVGVIIIIICLVCIVAFLPNAIDQFYGIGEHQR